MVSVVVTAVAPVTVTDAGTLQVGGMAAEPEMLQLNATTPVKLFDGVTEIVDVPMLPGVLMMIVPLLLSAKPGEVVSQFPTTGASTTF